MNLWYNYFMQRPFFIALLALTGSTVCAATQPRDVTVGEILRGDCVNEHVRTRGTVVEIFPDAVDTAFAHLFLSDGSEMTEVAFRSADIVLTNLDRLVGAKIRVKGDCLSKMGGWRRLSAPFIMGKPDIEVLKPAPKDLFAAETITSLQQLSNRHILQHGRHAVDGVVRAVWQRSNLLIENSTGLKVRVNLARRQPPPKFGDCVRVVGFSDTDTASLFLTSAIWKPTTTASVPDERPTALSEKGFRNDQLCSSLDGKLVSVDVVVRSPSGPVDAPNRLFATIGTIPLQIDPGGAPEIFQNISVGSTVRATGVFLVETESWTRRTPFPRISGYAVILRTADDLRVLQEPPWWTVRRLLALLGIFVALLVGVLIWNFALNRRANRKGRELAEEQLARVTADLKVSERTRLAVELHDALSQTLSGVSMQIDTAADFAKGNAPAISKCLNLASRTIDACRMELRNTLWDLRSAALDEPDMNTAIRKTLCQNLSGIDLAVRFNVPRERLSDNTAHAILKIIRELSANATRHGKATIIRIAGTIDCDQLLISVRDNGCGFDPDLAPGVSQGHFGLQGIAERLERLNGKMKIESAPGRGTKVSLSLPIPRSGE